MISQDADTHSEASVRRAALLAGVRLGLEAGATTLQERAVALRAEGVRKMTMVDEWPFMDKALELDELAAAIRALDAEEVARDE